MRELIENVVYSNFTAGLNEIRVGTQGTALEAYLMPMENLNWEERNIWLTDYHLRDIKKLLSTLNDKQLLLCLTEQHCEKFS